MALDCVNKHQLRAARLEAELKNGERKAVLDDIISDVNVIGSSD
jgi:hypothetical protein